MDEQLRLGDNDALVAVKRAWDKALALMEPEVNRPSFESFVKTAHPVAADDGACTIGAQSELGKVFLEKYYHILKPALENCVGKELDITIVVAPKQPAKARAVAVQEAKRASNTVTSFSQPFNDKYTFATFVVGSCNRMAHAAAKAVAENPGTAYNPFFLYGGPGLGKTHLLQAIGQHAMFKHPNLRVAYVSGESFTSHYVTAIREQRSEDFRQKYRNIDLWLLDDIQFLTGKERTKEEFFHTFNALQQMNKQIVLCSDRSPRDLAPAEERLKTRFESGLVADLAPPDIETRVAILQRKAKAEHADIPMPVLECVADLIPTNVRALEGALVTLMAYSSLMKANMCEELAKEVLGRYLAEKKYSEVTPEAIIRAVSHGFSVSVDDIIGAKRDKELALVRHIAMFLARQITECPLQKIGKAFGGKNHASVLHAVNRVESLLLEDAELRAKVDELSQGIRSGRLP